MNHKFIGLLFLVCGVFFSNVLAVKNSKELFDAAFTGDYQRLRAIIEDCENINERDLNGQIPLHYACSRGHIECVRILIENGANVNEKNKKGYTPLHAASCAGRVECVRMLLENDANPNEKSGIRGNTPIHLAILKRHLSFDMLITLLNYGANINEKMTWDGGTPLHEACHEGLSDYVRMLLENGANANDMNKFGETPFDKARSRGYGNILEILEPYKNSIEAKESFIVKQPCSKKRKRED